MPISNCDITNMWTFKRSEHQFQGDRHFLTLFSSSIPHNGSEKDIGQTWMRTCNLLRHITYMWKFTRSEHHFQGDEHFLTLLPPSILTPSMPQNGSENKIGQIWIPTSNCDTTNMRKFIHSEHQLYRETDFLITHFDPQHATQQLRE